MTLLAHVYTELGKIELHHEREFFTTRREFATVPDETPATCTILIDARRGREWYDLALRRGHVYQPFPADSAETEGNLQCQSH